MHGFKGERVLMRIHIGEADRFDGKPLYRQIVELLRSRHYAGATVLRGIMGFGASSRLHTDRFLELSMDLPVVIECIETKRRSRRSFRSSTTCLAVDSSRSNVPKSSCTGRRCRRSSGPGAGRST